MKHASQTPRPDRSSCFASSNKYSSGMNPCPRTDSDLDERWLALDSHLTAGARGWCSCPQPYLFPCLPLNPASKIIIMLGGTRVSCWGLFHVQDRSQYGFPPASASGCLVCGGQCSVSCCCLTYRPKLTGGIKPAQLFLRLWHLCIRISESARWSQLVSAP